jgi:hypothetical protein
MVFRGVTGKVFQGLSSGQPLMLYCSLFSPKSQNDETTDLLINKAGFLQNS